jgi:hypothetical protein
MRSADEFPSRFGDVIDDRAAGILDEMPSEWDARFPRRICTPLGHAARHLRRRQT